MLARARGRAAARRGRARAGMRSSPCGRRGPAERAPVGPGRGAGGCRLAARDRRRLRDRYRQGRLGGERPRRSSRVPTTYSGAEWPTTLRGADAPSASIVGGGSGANLAGIVYDVGLTLDLRARRYGRHLAERARPLRRGALRRRVSERERRVRALGARADRPLAPGGRRQRRRTVEARERAPARGGRGGRGARARRARARPRDGAGAREQLRPASRRDERPRAAARTALQRRDRPRRGRALRGGDRRRRRPAQARSRSSRGWAGSSRLRDFGVRRGRRCRRSRPRAAARAGNRQNPRPATPRPRSSRCFSRSTTHGSPIEISLANRVD